MFTIILFASALLISGIAEYFAIAGLVAIFSSSPIASIVLGGALAIGKLVAASWVYRNWDTAPKMLLYYFTAAVITLSLITSMGIFGYLSKAHLDHSLVIGDSSSQVEIIEERIKTEEQNITSYRNDLKILDAQIQKYTELGSVTRSVRARDQQKKERETLVGKLEESQNKISKYREELLPIKSESRKIEAEIGPIKYIAELIYGSSTQDIIDKAVRLTIIIIIFVFDPLAILLLIAANMEIKKKDQPWLEPMVMVDPEEIKVVKRQKVEPSKPSKKSIASGEDV